jgi:IS30 family transposase
MTLPYIHLSPAERREIARMHTAKIPIRVIADRLQRHRSTIYREIKRNWVHDEEPLYRGYFHVAADMQARARRQRLGQVLAFVAERQRGQDERHMFKLN